MILRIFEDSSTCLPSVALACTRFLRTARSSSTSQWMLRRCSLRSDCCAKQLVHQFLGQMYGFSPVC